MALHIFLDSALLSLLAKPPESPEVQAISEWVAACDAAGYRIIIPLSVATSNQRQFSLFIPADLWSNITP